MASRVRVELDKSQMNIILRSPSGLVTKEMRKRAERVKQRARTECPVDTGELRDSINIEEVAGTDGMSMRISASAEHAIYVIKGRRAITAGSIGYLAFQKNGKWIYTRHVRAVAPNNFLERAISAAR